MYMNTYLEINNVSIFYEFNKKFNLEYCTICFQKLTPTLNRTAKRVVIAQLCCNIMLTVYSFLI
jgi:hypothetical protein